MSEGLLVIQQGTVKVNRRGRQKKIWEDDVKKWTGVDFASLTTVKTLKIGTPRLTIVVVVNIKQFEFTMQ